MISDKTSLDELTYLYMMAKSVKFKRIGTFLSFGTKHIHQFGNDEHLVAMQSNLRSLMTRDGIDQLKLSIFLGINSYSNLDLLESYEFDDVMELDLKKCYDHLQMESNLFKTFLVDRGKQSSNMFLEPSPCFNMTNFPKCEKYCTWHYYAGRNDSARNLMRYFFEKDYSFIIRTVFILYFG